MLGIFVKNPWPSFYKRGMKTWEIRNYSTDYRGDVLIIESMTNQVVCKMTLKDCIPLNKERWEMNYEKHRTTCSYENLPYRKNGSSAFAWVLESPTLLSTQLIIRRIDSRPFIQLPESILNNHQLHPITFNAERIACKFIGDNMFLYWIKKTYFALVSITNTTSGYTQLITSEITSDEAEFMLEQLIV